jgi:glycosyltransferase involved in cell wall biosynthesis
VAIGLAGCDFGNSGIGVFARALVPRLTERLETRGARALTIGSAREHESIGLPLERGTLIPEFLSQPAASAAFSLLGLPLVARALGADLLYLPAANRRVVALPLVRTVGTVHDLAQFHVPAKYGRARQVYIEHVLTPLLRQLCLLTTVSAATALDVVQYAGVPDNRIRVVPNGVTLGDPDPAFVPRARPYLLYPARLEHPGKNHERLLEAFAASRARTTHDLLLAGADWGARERILKSIERLGLQGRVELLGFVSRDRLVSLLRSADVVVAAGLMEGFGLQAAEALAVGAPIAASNTDSLPEVVGDLGALFDPSDVASMQAALDRIVTDESLRERCRTLGPLRAERFSWDRAADAITEALWEMVDGAS